MVEALVRGIAQACLMKLIQDSMDLDSVEAINASDAYWLERDYQAILEKIQTFKESGIVPVY